MNKIVMIVSLVIGLGSAVTALAHSYQQGDIQIGHIWSRAMPAGQTTAAVYVPLLNTGNQPDKLTGASSPVANKVEIHQDMNMNNVSHMEKLDSVALDPGKPVAFKPGGLHFMLFGVKQIFKAGDKFPMTLQFEKAGSITVDVHVAAIGAESGE